MILALVASESLTGLKSMSLPNEMIHSIQTAGMFLQALMDSKKTPKIPLKIRMEARARLKHFPYCYSDLASLLKPEYKDVANPLAQLFRYDNGYFKKDKTK
jgi:hypothetical protein